MIVTSDTGLGTTYERWALNRFLIQIQNEYEIGSVFEGPDDGMTGIKGINSLVLGRGGSQVTFLSTNAEQTDFMGKVWSIYAPQANITITGACDGSRLPFEDGLFDLVWNFNVMARLEDPESMLNELCRISRKAILIIVPNRGNYSFGLHRLQHYMSKKPWDHGDVELLAPRIWMERLTSKNFMVKKVRYVDCPWWPDIVDLSELISDFFPFMRKYSEKAKPENRMKWSADQLPYYQPEKYPHIHRQMEKLSYLERSPLPILNRLFGHHVSILAVKKEATS